MKRSKFLKVLGFGAIGAVVAAKVAIELTKPVEPVVVGPGWITQIEERGKDYVLYMDRDQQKKFEGTLQEYLRQYPKTPYESYYDEYIEKRSKSWMHFKKNMESQGLKNRSKFF